MLKTKARQVVGRAELKAIERLKAGGQWPSYLTLDPQMRVFLVALCEELLLEMCKDD